MSVHVEWSTAESAFVGTVLPGSYVGNEGKVDRDKFGLVMGSDSLHVFEGTREQLVAFAEQVAKAVAQMPERMPILREIRAGDMLTAEPTHLRSDSDEDWQAIAKIDEHGDTVLVITESAPPVLLSFDRDEPVEVLTTGGTDV